MSRGRVVFWVIVAIVVKITMPNVFTSVVQYIQAIFMGIFCFIAWLAEVLGPILFSAVMVIVILATIFYLAQQDRK